MKRKKEHETFLLVQRCLVTLWLSYKQHSTGWQLQKIVLLVSETRNGFSRFIDDFHNLTRFI